MTRRRIERVNQLLREELSTLIRRSAKDPRLAAVSVMAVRSTTDLKHAKVYVRAGGDEEALAEAIQGLESAQGYLRRELGRTLHLRRVPEFTFEPDRTIEHARRIDDLLREARPDDGWPSEAEPPVESPGDRSDPERGDGA